MKRRNRKIKLTPKLMIIPMIDIIFFLLVFFMYSSLYSASEQQIPLNLPKASSASARVLTPITITCKANGELYIDNQPVSDKDLTVEINRYIAKDRNQAFIVRADRGIIYDRVIEILDKLKISGAKSVSVATERK